MANTGEGATVRRMWLATELRRLRNERKLTAEQAAAELDWSHSKVSRIEGCKVGVSSTDVAAMCDLYGVPPDRKQGIVKIAKQARQKTWVHAFADIALGSFGQLVGLEGSATRLRMFEGMVLPGLLQTNAYAMAVSKATLITDDEATVDRTVELRMRRQSILERKKPPTLWAIVTEGVLRQQVGSPKVMREQIEHLLNVADRPSVTLQVLPFDAGAHAAMTGSFVLLDFPKPFPVIVYTDSATHSSCTHNEPDVDRHSLIFDHLMARALDTERSIELLREVRAVH